MESDVNRFASLSDSFRDKRPMQDEQGAVGGDLDNDTYPPGVVDSMMQESVAGGDLSESSGTCRSTGAGSMSGSTSTVKQEKDSGEGEGPGSCGCGHKGEGPSSCGSGHKEEGPGSCGCGQKVEGEGQCNGSMNATVVCQRQSGVQCDSGVDLTTKDGATVGANNVHLGVVPGADVDVKHSTSLCNGELINRTYDGEAVSKSPSDTHIVNGHLCNGGLLPCSVKKEETSLVIPVSSPCNRTSDTSLLAENLHKLALEDEELDTKVTQNTTSKNVHTGDQNSIPLLNSRSSESLGHNTEGGRNSPKSPSPTGTPEILPKKVCPSFCRQASNRHSKRKEAKVKSTMTLGQRYQPSSRECSIMSCLHQFTSAELLTGNNRFGCINCTRIKHKQHPNKGQ